MIFLEVEAGGGIVKFNGDICSTSTFDLPMSAGSITWDGLKCPVAAGDVKAGTKIKLAGALPASLAQATISIKGENNSKHHRCKPRNCRRHGHRMRLVHSYRFQPSFETF